MAKKVIVHKSTPLSISGTPVLTGKNGDPIQPWTATASGGKPPYAFSMVGAWPNDIALITDSTTARPIGTFTEDGTFTGLSIQVQDSLLKIARLPLFTMVIDPVVSGGLIGSAIDLLGYDPDADTGPRYSFTNVFLDVPEGGTLISGVTRGAGASAHVISFGTGTYTLDRWDLSGGCLVIDGGATVICNDCKFAPSLTASTGIPVDVFGNNSSFTANYCDFDGSHLTISGPTLMARVRGGYTGASQTYSYCRFHGTYSDGINGGFLTIDHCYFYDFAYGTGAHADHIQIINGSNIDISYCLFDGSYNGEPVYVNNCLRLIAEVGGTIDNILVHHNILVNVGQQPPIGVGCNNLTPVGVAATNYHIHDNWVRKDQASSYVYVYPMTGGTNRWYNNLILDTLVSIAAPDGTWATS